MFWVIDWLSRCYIDKHQLSILSTVLRPFANFRYVVRTGWKRGWHAVNITDANTHRHSTYRPTVRPHDMQHIVMNSQNEKRFSLLPGKRYLIRLVTHHMRTIQPILFGLWFGTWLLQIVSKRQKNCLVVCRWPEIKQTEQSSEKYSIRQPVSVYELVSSTQIIAILAISLCIYTV